MFKLIAGIVVIIAIVILAYYPIYLYKKGKFKRTVLFSIVVIALAFVVKMESNLIFNLSAAKPIIYLYPEQETEINVKLCNPDIITCSYPRYDSEWKVIAKPNGDLIDLKTGRNLYALYWEGKGFIKENREDGFVVKGEDSSRFLEEKLEILGLNEREAEEFIVYWLPQLEENEYNFIRFASQEEIEKIMPLEVNPKPETVIRVYMEFKSVNRNYRYNEQQLEKVERNGFTLVEWGGIKYN